MSRNHFAGRPRNPSRPYQAEWGSRPPATATATRDTTITSFQLSQLTPEALGSLVAQSLGSDVSRIVEVFTIALSQANSAELAAAAATPPPPLFTRSPGGSLGGSLGGEEWRAELRQPDHTLDDSNGAPVDAAMVTARRQDLTNLGAAVFAMAKAVSGNGRQAAG